MPGNVVVAETKLAVQVFGCGLLPFRETIVALMTEGFRKFMIEDREGVRTFMFGALTDPVRPAYKHRDLIDSVRLARGGGWSFYESRRCVLRLFGCSMDYGYPHSAEDEIILGALSALLGFEVRMESGNKANLWKAQVLEPGDILRSI